MKKDTFKTSIFILLIGGFLTKVLGFIIKILFTREVGEYGISLYTIIMPTYSLFITFATFSLPISISKLVSEGKRRSKRILFSTAFFILGFNVLLVSFLILSSSFIANYLLKQPQVTPLLIALSCTLPFLSLSSILKGYFLGKLKVIPNTISNIFEQFVRIFFLLFFLPKIVKQNVFWGVISFLLLNIVTETVSIFTFCAFLPKKQVITKQDLKPDAEIIKRVLHISIPSVSSRIIGNIGFFLEPILLTNILLSVGYSNQYILEQYAAYNAYAVGLLTLPSFFIQAICQILIPEVSKYHSAKNVCSLKRRIKQALRYSFIIGFFSSIFLSFFRSSLLKIIYQTTLGSDYIFILAPFFVLFYLEAPLSSSLQAMDLAGDTMKISLWGIFLKLGSMCLLSFLKIGLYSLVFSEIINIIFVVFFNWKAVQKEIHKMEKVSF